MFPLLSSAILLLILKHTTCDGKNIKVLVAVDTDFSIKWESDIFAATKASANLASKKYLQGLDISVEVIQDLSSVLEKGFIDEYELSILLIIAPCNSTWRIHQKLKKEVVLLASITEADCPRLPIMEGLTIPLLTKEEQISQIILDLRSEKVLQWKEATIIYDDSISSLLADRVAKVLSEEIYDGEGRASLAAISTGIFKVDESESENTIQTQAQHFLSVPRTSKSRVNFLGFLKSENTEIILGEAQRMGLVDTKNHWLFCLADLKKNVSSFAPLVNEGGHVAFLYGTQRAPKTRMKDGKKRPSNRPTSGRIKVADEENQVAEDGSSILRRELTQFMFALARSLKHLHDAERELYSRVSEEEWEALRPTAGDHRDALLAYLKESIQEGDEQDDDEEEWRVAAVVTWGGASAASPADSAATLLAAATWDPRVGLVSFDHVFPHARHGFRGKRVTIVTYHNPPWSTIYLNDSGSIVERKGLIFDILDELARNLNFSYSLVLARDDRGGIRGGKEDDPGIPRNLSSLAASAVDVVRRGGALLGANAFVASPRLESSGVSATEPVAAERHAFLTSRPQVLSRALIFMAPFASDTWFCIAVSVLIMGPVLYWVHNLTPYYEFHGLRHKSRITRKAKRKLSIAVKLTAFDKIWKCLWYVYGALLQQGGIQVPMADSGRIVIGTWWLVVIVVMTTYCGNLVAFLTFPTVSTTISTLDELKEALADVSGDKHLSLGIIDEAADRVNLKEAEDSRLRYLSSTALVHEALARDGNRSADNRRVLDAVRRGNHVLVARLTHLLLLAEEDYLVVQRCDFNIGGETFLGENLVMIVAKNSPYLILINEEIKKMHHGGLIQKWTSDSMPKKGLCKEKSHERGGSSTESKSDTAKNREVKLDDMQGSFFVLFIGCFLALLTIGLEYAWHRREVIHQKLAGKF